jgi:hypothetical protein
MEVLLPIGLFVVGAAWALVRYLRTSAERTTALATIGSFLGGGHSEPDARAWGANLGAAAELRYVTRGSGSGEERWTEIDVDLPQHHPVAINVRRHGWLDRSRIKRAEMVDLELGDPAFDQAFLVEAAPSDVVRALLDQPVRNLLSRYQHVELTDVVVDNRHVLRFAVLGWMLEVDAARAALGLIVGIARQLRDTYAAADQAIEAPATGAPYRSEIDERGRREAQRARAVQVAEVDRLRATRADRTKLFTRIALFAAIGVVSVLIIFASR